MSSDAPNAINMMLSAAAIMTHGRTLNLGTYYVSLFLNHFVKRRVLNCLPYLKCKKTIHHAFCFALFTLEQVIIFCSCIGTIS